MFSTSISNLPCTSSVTIKKMYSLGINTYADLLNYFPTRYDSYVIKSPIGRVQPGEQITITGTIKKVTYVPIRSNLKIQEFILEDSTGSMHLTFYNQPYLLRSFNVGIKLSCAGLIERFGSKLVMKPIHYEIGEPSIHTGRIIPIYSEAKGLSSRTIREKMHHVVTLLHSRENEDDFLPEKICLYNDLIPRNNAYQQIHFPDNVREMEKAKMRLSFDELFTFQLSSGIVKEGWKKENIKSRFIIDEDKDRKLKNFISHLPFVLTHSQEKIWKEIQHDLIQLSAMNRLLQGDVGSGKTVIAALGAYVSYLNNFRTLIMAPTEILAEQHFVTIKTLYKNTDVRIGLLTASEKINPKKLDTLDIIIGTHALVQKSVSFNNVGLVVVDEQQRFGVSQRAMLKEKGAHPHLLTMTATPIPRTVALTLYGELDFSVIKEMPKGRIPIKSFFVPKVKRMDCYEWVKKEIRENKSQVFVVCPFIEESETETLKSIKAAKVEYESLKKIFSNFSVGLLHGRMKSKEKNSVMSDFKKGKYDILVATPVVEVGIDISNATVMIVEGAERYGLAQLHQLRGRVGRGDKQSYCYLFTEREEKTIVSRLRFFAGTSSGHELAEYDLKHRGPGAIFGTQQHGFADLKIASLTDFDLIARTKNAVSYFMLHCELKEYPLLHKHIKKFTNQPVSRD